MSRTPDQAASSTNFLIVVVCVSAVLIFGVFVFWPGKPATPQCIQVPELTQEASRKPALDLAIKLENVKLDSELKANVEELSKTTFQTLPEKELALLLLLRAIDCYSHAAKTPAQQELIKPVLAELAATIRSMWASQHELKGEADRLSLKELTILNKSRYAQDILSDLKKYGIDQ